jgi:hypothetical protein
VRQVIEAGRERIRGSSLGVDGRNLFHGLADGEVPAYCG